MIDQRIVDLTEQLKAAQFQEAERDAPLALERYRAALAELRAAADAAAESLEPLIDRANQACLEASAAEWRLRELRGEVVLPASIADDTMRAGSLHPLSKPIAGYLEDRRRDRERWAALHAIRAEAEDSGG